ncbi:MAG: metallophosphoesterase [Bacteroidales bacterium]|nr:metallophosphoesterase [Bacteroidales bacterium]
MSYSLKITSRMVNNRPAIIAMFLLTICAAILGGCKKSSTEEQKDGTSAKLRFVFLADSRGDSLGYTVDTTALNPIIRRIDTLNPQPSFVVFGGDGCYRGYLAKHYTFQEFKNLFATLTGKGIALYTTMGNHELYHEHASYGYFLVNQQQFQLTFSENPSNGPAGYEHLAYSFTDAATSSYFAVLDPYFVTGDTMHLNMGGHIDPTQMAWLKTQVAQTSALHKFLFIHVPYYYVDNDSTEASEADTTITSLWSFIDANKFDIYACGHSHLYSRRTIDGGLTPNPQTKPPVPAWQNNVVQLLCGTCGAGSGGGYIDPTVRSEWNVYNDHKTYYFSVIDISGNTVTVNSYHGYTGAYTVFDTFTVTK